MSLYSSGAAEVALSTVAGRDQQSAPDAQPTASATQEEHGADQDAQKPARAFFRRPRAGRACGTCHSRRVRCDAGSHGLPCTNCAAFSLECSIPPKQKKKRKGDAAGSLKCHRPRGRSTQRYREEKNIEASIPTSPAGTTSTVLEDRLYIKPSPDDTDTYVKLVKPEATSCEIEDPGRVAYLEEFSNMSLIIQEYQGHVGVHYPLPKVSKDRALSSKMNQVELDILQRRGALSLPPKELCDELIDGYFKWVAPIVPIINRAAFLRRYRDPSNPPSILLMQAVLLAGSRVCDTPLLLDSNGSPISAATLLYQRVKALYDADYEEDRVTIVQALMLMGWYWEDPSRVPKNVFYWNGLATAVAQGCGMHRSTKNSRLSISDQRLWTRIWWTLYTRDRSVAAALGRPSHISLDGSDVEMVCEDDFIEDQDKQPNTFHVQVFLQYVKLCEIMDMILFQNYSVSPKAQQGRAMALTQCDLALAEWLQHCPPELRWNQSRYNFWSAYLNCVYNTASCLLHRAHLPPVPSQPLTCLFSPRSPALESARMITSIVQSLIAHDDLRHTPPFIIYSLLSALMVHIYHLHTQTEAQSQQQSIVTCMEALERVSGIWLVGKMVHDLFEAILALDGFDRYIKARPSQSRDENLQNKESSPKEIELSDKFTSDLHASEKGIMSLTLTPSLVAHLDAALKSASSPDESEIVLSASIQKTTSSVTPDEKHTCGKDPRPVAPRTKDSEESISSGTSYKYPSTPDYAGLNAVEWLQFFGIQ